MRPILRSTVLRAGPQATASTCFVAGLGGAPCGRASSIAAGIELAGQVLGWSAADTDERALLRETAPAWPIPTA